MDKLKMQTPNITNMNIERIAKLFPNVVTETQDDEGNTTRAIDFELLKQQLSDILVEDDDERYRLDWPGKKASLLKANTPITKTLRPCREESVNFDTTENVYIEGDNFEVLKILQESYLNKIKMIYIDPPYNTGNDFVYKDDFKKSKEAYEEALGVDNEDGGKLFKNTDTNGRFHSDWLSMMYERLVVARDLLKDDGAIFISIDDNEVHNLRKICDEIFGEENFVSQLIWRRRKTQANLVKNIAPVHDFILVYSKSISILSINKLPFPQSHINKTFKNPDNDPKGVYQTRPLAQPESSSNPRYEIELPNGRTITARWSCSKTTYQKYILENRLYIPNNGEGMPRLKIYLSESNGLIPNTWLDNIATTEEGSKEVTNIFGKSTYFDFPKPTGLIKHLIILGSGKNSIVLDFFSGSATTAHAIMQLNAEDGGNRKFIMVQLPEKTDEKSEAYKAGYKTISDIGKERIRRAGKNIVNEQKKEPTLFDDKSALDLDIGFRVYKTDTSNMKDVFYHPSELDQQSIEDLISNIKEDRTSEDLLTQVILDLGLELNLPIEKKEIKGNTIFIVQHNALVACFDDDINFGIVDEIAKLEPFKAVFKDASFADDKDRINVENRFKRLSPETRITVI